MKFLVTGFRPFGGRNINSSWLAVQNLPADVNGNEIRTCELPVSYTESDKVLIEAIEREHPDTVLCVGQNASIACIHVETTAENYAHSDEPDEDNNLWLYRSIDMLGQPSYRSNLPTEDIYKNIKKQNIDAEVSNFAGTFVCNYVMYRLLQYREEKAPGLAAGFIHVPCVPEQCVGRFSGNPGMPLEQIVAALTTAINTIAGTNDVRTKPESRNSGMTKPESSPDVPKESETAPAAESSTDVPKEPETAPAAESSPDVPKEPETAPAAESSTDVPKEPETAPITEISLDEPKEPVTAPVEEISLNEPKEAVTAPIAEISLDEPKETVSAPVEEISPAVSAETGQRPTEGKVSVGEELWKLRAGISKQPHEPAPTPRVTNVNAVEYREGFPGQPMLTGDYRVFRVDDKFKGAEPEEQVSLHQYMEDNIPERPKTQIEQIREMRENRIREREEIRRFFRNGETEDEYKERCRKACLAESEKKHIMYGDIQVLNENVYGAVSTTRDLIVDNCIFRVRETAIKEGGIVVAYHLTEMNTTNNTVIREIGDFPTHLMDYEQYYLYLALTEMRTLTIQPDTLEITISNER